MIGVTIIAHSFRIGRLLMWLVITGSLWKW
jgi:hypothetical protein